MANILKITGRKEDFIYNPDMVLISGLGLFAHYRGTQYYLSGLKENITIDEKDSKSEVALHFLREDRKDVPDGLNKILLTTNCEGSYEATGISRLNSVPAKRLDVKLYIFGDDLKIDVDDSADKAIRSIPRLIKEKHSGDISDDFIAS